MSVLCQYDILLMLAPLVCLSYPPTLGQVYISWYNLSIMVNSCGPEIFGADPVNLQWRVVRGDTATLKIEFFENDETTYYNTDGWTYKATAYDQSGDVLDALECSASDGYVTVTALPSVTENWGLNYLSTVAELPFDLQVIIPDDVNDITWTPIIGTIYVLGDVSPGGSL